MPTRKKTTTPKVLHEVGLSELIAGLIGKKKLRVDERVTRLESFYNVPFPNDLSRFLSAVLSAPQGIQYFEWRFSSGEVFCPQDSRVGLFEQIVLADQENYLGTWMIEIFTNTLFVGSLGNGDGYYISLPEKSDKVKGNEILLFDHEVFQFTSTIADSLESLSKMTALLDQTRALESESPDKEVKKIVQSLKKKVNFSWHFESLSKISGITPKYQESDFFAKVEWRYYRASWLVSLLKADGAQTLPDIIKGYLSQRSMMEKSQGRVYSIQDIIPLFLKGNRANTVPVTVVYYIWEAYFCEPESLDALCDVLKNNPSPLIQDVIRFVQEFSTGKRKKLGKIKDLPALQKKFFDAMTTAREVSSPKKKVHPVVDTVALLKDLPIEEVPQLLWKYHTDEKTMLEIAKYLEQQVPSLQSDFARIDFLRKNKSSRKGFSFEFENEEIYQVFIEKTSDLSPLLYHMHIPVRDVRAIPSITSDVRALKDSLDVVGDISMSTALRSLAYLPVPELEDDLLALLPPPKYPTDIVEQMKFEDTVIALLPGLVAMKSIKVVAYLSTMVTAIIEQMKGEGDDSARARNCLLRKLGYVVIRACADIGHDSAKPVLQSLLALNSDLTPFALSALLEMGDQGSMEPIRTLSEKSLGELKDNMLPATLLAFAIDRTGGQPDIQVAKTALTTILPKHEDTTELHLMALTVVAHHEEKESAKSLIRPFLGSIFAKVRVRARELLKELGEDVALVYMDRATVDALYESKGKSPLLDALQDPNTVFKHNIIRKLVEKKDTDGLVRPAIEYFRSFARFTYYAYSYAVDRWEAMDYACYALLEWKNKEVDDVIYELYQHPNILFRSNDAFRYGNYPQSAYLKKLLKALESTPPNPKSTEAPSEKSERLTIESFSTSSDAKRWILGVKVTGIAFHPDGSRAVASGAGRTILFDGEGKEVVTLQDGGHAYDAIFDPAGKRVAVGFHAGHVHIFDSQTGELLQKFQHGGVPTGTQKVKFSPDGAVIASASDDGELKLWNPKNGKLIHTFELGIDVNALDWSPDGTKIVAGLDRGIAVLDVVKQKVSKKVNCGHVADVQIFLDGKKKLRIVVGGGASVISILDEKYTVIKKLRQSMISRLRLSKDQKYLYASSWDGDDAGLSRWDMKTGKRTKIVGGNTGLFGMDIHPITGEVYAGGRESAVLHWDEQLNLSSSSTYVGHKSEIESMYFDPIDGTLYTASNEDEIICWKEGGEPTMLATPKGVSLIESLLMLPDRKTLLIGADDAIVEFDLQTGKSKLVKTKNRTRSLVQFGDHVLVSSGYVVTVFGAKQSSAKFPDSVHKMLLVKGKKELVVAPFLDSWIAILDAETLRTKKNIILPVSVHGVYDVALAPDESVLYVTSSDNVVYVFETSTWELKQKFSDRSSFDHVAISPDGMFVALVSDAKLKVLNAKDFSLFGEILVKESVEEMVFTNNETIAIAGSQGLVQKIKIQKV